MKALPVLITCLLMTACSKPAAEPARAEPAYEITNAFRLPSRIVMVSNLDAYSHPAFVDALLGACAAVSADPASFKGVEEIVILNRHRAKGMVFYDLSIAPEVTAALESGDQQLATLTLLSKTRMVMASGQDSWVFQLKGL